MKRSLALIAIVAIVASMFSGIVLAEGEFVIELNKDQLTKDEGSGYAKLTGRILVDDVYDKTYDGKDVYVDGVKMAQVDGYSFTVLASTTTVGTFDIVVDVDDDGVTATDLKTTYDVLYDLTLDQDLEFDFPSEDFVIIEGNLEGADENIEVALGYQGSAAFASGKTNDDGDFIIVFNAELALTHAGDLELVSEGLVYAEGQVNPADFTAELSIPEFPEGLLDQEVELTIDDIDSEYLNDDEDALAGAYHFEIVVEDEDDEEVTDLAINSFSELEAALAWDLNDLNALEDGEYTVTISLYEGSDLLMESTTALTVVNPTSYTLVGWHRFEESTVQAINMIIAGPGQNLTVYDEDEPVDGYVITFEGAGIDETVAHNLSAQDADLPNDVDSDDYVADTVELNPTNAGTITVTIDAYQIKSGDWELVKTYEKEIAVTGYSVEANLDEVIAEQEYDLTLVVVDEDGNPVNNAEVFVGPNYADALPADAEAVVDPAETNITGGSYTVEDWSHDTVEKLDIVVVKGGEIQASLSDVIDVVGEEVYNVESDVTTLLVGGEETIVISITDADGEIMFPEDVAVVENGSAVWGDKKDTDDDNIKDAIEVTVSVDADAEDNITLRVTSDEGKERGEIVLGVVKPLVKLNSGENLTENLISALNFTVVDPRDDSVIDDKDIYLEVENLNVDNDGDSPETVVYDEEENEIDNFNGSFEADEAYDYYILFSNVDHDAAADEEVTPGLIIKVEMQDGVMVEALTLPIGEATLAATPETLIMGTSSLVTLTYTDANGQPVADKDINIEDEEIGTTDENGQVVYAASSVSTTGITFNAETDVDDTTTELKVKSELDFEAPVVSAPAEVSEGKVNVTITDNVRIAGLKINGEMIAIFPVAQIVEEVALEEGANTIRVEAVDVNNNVVSEVITVTYTTPARAEVQVGVDTGYGAPQLIEGTTMVPVRVAERDLGASMAWDNTTKTATYSLDGISISVTVGSTTALVNGENVELPVAPMLINNRTYVPLRMIAQELGFNVQWTSNNAPVVITK